jgi:hypothetical protein
VGKLQNLQQSARRSFLVFFAILFVTALATQLLPSVASATGQITTRSITLGSSAPSTATTYKLTFTPVTTAQELIVDFCANDPLITDTCTFAAGTVPTVASPVSSLGTAAAVGSGSPVHTIKVTGLTETGGSPFTITFTSGVTNPTTATSFYARVLTSATGGATQYVPANTSGNTPTLGTSPAPTDSGGIALTTAANISVTSKVFETLAFCVFQTSCGTPPALTLGDPTTGALSVANAYVNNNAQYTLATNAGSGVGVTMTGTTLCRPGGTCTTGANAFTISAVGNTAAVKAVGTEQFGMCVDTTGATGGLVATVPYSDTVNACHTGLTTGIYAGTSNFGFNDSASAGGSNNAAGTSLLTSTGAVSSYTGTFAFLGDIAATTEAGLYTTSLNLVATGTF